MGLLGLSRFARLFLLLTILLIIPTLYLLYPSHTQAPSPGDEIYEYEAGGIDSPHWREPVKPDFETEEVRDWGDELVVGCPAGKDCGDGPLKGGMEMEVEDGRGSGLGMVDEGVLGGGVIMPKLENAITKAELGRAAWKVLHLMTLRYPEEPTPDDRTALKSYFHLFARLYPCGECAAEFQALLKEYPPQTSSRKTASLWLCSVHNLINFRLGKEEFDCLTLDATYDCGCGDEAVTTRSEGNGTDGPTRVTLVGGANVGSEHEVPGMRGELGDDVKEKLYEAV